MSILIATGAEFGITAVAHPALRDVRPTCQQCLDHAEGAALLAKVTGSVGSTSEDGGHSATVVRLVK